MLFPICFADAKHSVVANINGLPGMFLFTTDTVEPPFGRRYSESETQLFQVFPIVISRSAMQSSVCQVCVQHVRCSPFSMDRSSSIDEFDARRVDEHERLNARGAI